MNRTRSLVIAVVAIAFVASGWALFALGERHGASRSQSSAGATPASTTSDNGRKVLYYHDPMVPGRKFDKPGKSPFMDMQLVPVYADEGASANGGGGVTIDPRAQQNLGIRTAEVVSGTLTRGIEVVGNVAWNERDVAVVAARANGYIERLLVRAPLDPVTKGQTIAALYVPDWVAAQEEYLAVRRMVAADAARTDLRPLVDGARQRMRLAGMTDAQIARVESLDRVEPRIAVVSPIAGVVGDLGVREGAAVTIGMPIARINGLSSVWINAELPEGLAASLKRDTAVEAKLADGSSVAAKVSAILPEVNAQTRTLKVRIEADNVGRKMLPGMFATLAFRPAASSDMLVVPTETIIATGTRKIVMLAEPGGRFVPVEVETGLEANGKTEVRKGLSAGQRVVLSGQFLIDSEASLKGFEAKGIAQEATPPAATQPTYRGSGKVESVDKDGITLSHGPIAGLGWPAMTMAFRPPPEGTPKDLAVGSQVDFEIRPTNDGQFQIVTIVQRGTRVGGEP